MEHKQGTVFYFHTQIGNLNGKVDLSDGTPETFDTADEAIRSGKDQTEEYGLRSVIYKCVPILQIDRGRIRTKKLMKG